MAVPSGATGAVVEYILATPWSYSYTPIPMQCQTLYPSSSFSVCSVVGAVEVVIVCLSWLTWSSVSLSSWSSYPCWSRWFFSSISWLLDYLTLEHRHHCRHSRVDVMTGLLAILLSSGGSSPYFPPNTLPNLIQLLNLPSSTSDVPPFLPSQAEPQQSPSS